MQSSGRLEELTEPLTRYSSSTNSKYEEENDKVHEKLSRRVWIESKKLWHIVGPAILSRLSAFSMFVITQAFAGHLGDLELAAMSISSGIINGFSFGLLLGMASALETLCGQAFGAKKYHMLGVYLQRSWIVLFICCILLLPTYIFATPILILLGQPRDVAELSGFVSLCFIPLHFSFAIQFPVQRFLQSQLKTHVIALVSLVALALHVTMSWFFVYGLKLGLLGTCVVLNISWFVIAVGLIGYTVFGGCPLTWSGFSMEAFSGLWDFVKLSTSSGVMLCLENWYYRILIVMTGNLKNAEIAVDALSICMNINGWEMMIPLAFFAGTGKYEACENNKRRKIMALSDSEFRVWLSHELLKKGDATSRLARLATGPLFMAQEYKKYRLNGYVFGTSVYEKNTNIQNSGISYKALTYFRASAKDRNLIEAEMTYYGVIRNIFELDYISFKEVVFYCDWVRVEDKNACKVDPGTNLIMVDLSKLKSNEHVSDEPFVCAFQKVKQVFYSEYINNETWSIVIHAPKRLNTTVDDLAAPIEYQSILDDNPNLKQFLYL